MNILLLEPAAQGDEFVITPAPNAYIIAVRLTPAQAEHFLGHDRIAVTLHITAADQAEIRRLQSVTEDGNPGVNLFNDFDAPEGTINVLKELETKLNTMVVDFYNAVAPDLDEYYSQVAAPIRASALADKLHSSEMGDGDLMDVLRAILGGGPQA